MFVAGQTGVIEPPYNDIWTVPGEEAQLPVWKAEDAQLFGSVNPMEYFHRLQIQDFLQSIIEGRPPSISGQEGRDVVALFTAIYRATRDHRAVKFPLSAE
jgi:predicted dehydrogenase